MRIFVDGIADDNLVELEKCLISLGHDVESGFAFVSSERKVDAAILYLVPLKETRSVSMESHFRVVFENLEKTLLPNRICIIVDRMDFASNYHVIVGSWPRIQPKVIRWINEISIKEESQKNFQVYSNITTLENALFAVVNSSNNFDNIRVFSFSSREGAKLLNCYKDLSIEKATILLRGFTIVDKFLQLSVEETINDSIDLWNRMSRSGNIKNLRIFRFDFHPTHEIYLFDDRYAIWRNIYYDFKSGDYTFDDEVLLIDSSTEFGKHFINKNIASFDDLLDNYSNI